MTDSSSHQKLIWEGNSSGLAVIKILTMHCQKGIRPEEKPCLIASSLERRCNSMAVDMSIAG